MDDERPDWFTAEREAEFMRAFEAQVAHHHRNSRYGKLVPSLTHSLEVVCGADPRVILERLIDGARVEDLLVEYEATEVPGLAALQAEVADLQSRLAAAASPSENTTAAVGAASAALDLVERLFPRIATS